MTLESTRSFASSDSLLPLFFLMLPGQPAFFFSNHTLMKPGQRETPFVQTQFQIEQAHKQTRAINQLRILASRWTNCKRNTILQTITIQL